ncbi:putative ribonuclease H-like domain-containing protein [Tanacetum coccineum]|uniref:Ribonuclease H-like domain-containing protein n=1 Tax=Tanacetum coccineum TaxID=301880 RepID=A0ABQ5DDX6_9ASTR
MDYIKLLKLVYVDDIIFGSTKNELCIAFEKLMHEKFQMSSIGELTFFLGLHVKQKKDGIFISQDKYDKDGEEVDVHIYRSMIGSLMYLTSSRPDIMFAVCACARYQVNPKVSHLHAVKMIFSDYAGASLDRKSTTRGCQFLGCRLISWQCKKHTMVANSTTKVEYVAASSCCRQVLWIQNQLLDYGYNLMHTKIFIDNNRKAKKTIKLMMEKLLRIELELILVKTINEEEQLHALVDGKKIIITESSVRRDLQLADEEARSNSGSPHQTVTQLLMDSLICKIFNRITRLRYLSVLSQPQRTQKPRKPKRKDTQIPQSSDPIENFANEAVHKELGDSLVRAATIASSLEAEQDSGNINKTQSNTLVLYGFYPKENDEVNVVEEVVEVINTAKLITDVTTVSAATTTTAIITTVDDITLAQAVIEIKSTKPKEKGVVIQELAYEEKRLAREKAKKEKEANIALIKTWDDIQAKIDADYQLAKRMQAQEKEKLSIEEKATLFQQPLEKRRKHFAAKRAKEKRNKPPTKAQQRKIMCTYLKNMEGYKLQDLKLKVFDSIQEMFDKTFKRVNTFEDFRTELVEGKEKRAGTELVQEITKKQKVKDDKETTKLKQCLEIIPDEEDVTINAIPLAVKSPSIVA